MVLPGDRLHLCCLGGVGGQGFFTEYVLAGLCGFDDPFVVQRVGQGNVDRFHSRVCQQRFIAVIGLGKAEFRPELFCLARGASGDGVELAVLRQLHTGDSAAPGDVGGAEHAPFDLAHVIASRFSYHIDTKSAVVGYSISR